MSALRRALRAGDVRGTVLELPEAVYERVALVVLGAWIVLPLGLWWPGSWVGVGVLSLAWADLQVGLVALSVGMLLWGACREGAKLSANRNPGRDCLPLALFGIFLALAVVACIVHPTEATLWGDGYRRESIFTYLSYVGFFFLASQVLVPAHRTALVGLVVGLVTVTCVVTLVAAVAGGWGSGDWSAAVRSQAYLWNFNHYGYLLAVGGALAASGSLFASRAGVRWGLRAVFALVVLTLQFNDTLGAYLALVTGCVLVVVWLAAVGRPWARGAAALAVIVGGAQAASSLLGGGLLADLIALIQDVRTVSSGAEDAADAGSGRWALWVSSVEQIATSPWLGHGVEGIADALPGVTGRSHNEYLQYAAFFGIPALIAYLLAVLAVFARFVRRSPQLDPVTVCAATAAATYLVSAFFGNTMFYTAPFLFLLLGLVWGGVRHGARPPDWNIHSESGIVIP